MLILLTYLFKISPQKRGPSEPLEELLPNIYREVDTMTKRGNYDRYGDAPLRSSSRAGLDFRVCPSCMSYPLRIIN